MTSPSCRVGTPCLEKEVALIQDFLFALVPVFALTQAAGATPTIIVAMNRQATSRPCLKSISLILRGKGRAPPWELPRWFS